MKTKELLPIGSVVKLEGADKTILVIGIKQRHPDSDEVMDYIGVTYPEGYINNVLFFTFNHDNITDIVFRGYECEERKEFLQAVAVMLKEEEADS